MFKEHEIFLHAKSIGVAEKTVSQNNKWCSKNITENLTIGESFLSVGQKVMRQINEKLSVAIATVLKTFIN